MTNPCSPNTSEPQSGLGTTLVYDAAKLAQFLVQEEMSWLSPLVPQIGGQSYDLATFCAADPADPTTDATTIAGFFSPLNPTGAADLRDWLVQVVDRGVWYASCQCSAGPAPTPPSPISQPTDVNLQPPDTTASGNCFTGSATHTPNYSNQQSWNFNDALPAGDGPSDGEFLRRQVPIPIPSSVTFTADVGSDGANPSNVQFIVNFYTATNSSITASTFSSPTVTQGTTYDSPTIPVPANAVYWQLIAIDTPGGSAVTNTITVNVTIYCQGQGPNTLGMVCCPTDPNLLAMIQQVLDELMTLESLIPARVPNYAAGTAHSGLSGGGSLTLDSTTIAVKVVFDSLPPNYGLVPGVPNTYFEIGWVSPDTNEGVQAGIRLTRQTQVIPLPEASSGIEYSFATRSSVTITELQAG